MRLPSRRAGRYGKYPNNGPGWALLGRTYAQTLQFADAEKAFQKASALMPGDASVLADWAEIKFLAHNRQWDEPARELVRRALAINPNDPKARELSKGALGKTP